MEFTPIAVRDASGRLLYISLSPPPKSDWVEFEEGGKVYVYSLRDIVSKLRSRYAPVWGGSIGYAFVLNGKIVLANPAFLNALGDVQGKEFEEVFGFRVSEGKRELFDKTVFVRRISERPEVFEVALAPAADSVFRKMVESAIDAFIHIDASGKILYVNPAVSIYGYRPEELVGRSIYEFLPKENVEKVKERIANAVSSGKSQRMEVEIYDASGNLRVVEAVGSLIGRDNGIIVLRDVTARRKAIEKFQRTLALYNALLESSPDYILLVDREGRIIFANGTFRNLAGYVEGRKITELVKGDIESDLSRALESGEVVRGVANLGNSLLEYSARFVYDENGEAIYAVVIMRDVTEREKLRRKLEERETLYRTLTEYSHTAIFIIQDDRIVYANSKLSEILGYTMEDINNLPHPYDVIHPEHRDLAKSRLYARLRGENVPESYEVKVLTKDGRVRWLKVLARRIELKGKPAILVNLADITDIKENEEKLRKINRLLRVVSSVAKAVSIERSEISILSKLPRLLEEIGDSAVFYGKNLTMLSSSGVEEEEALKLAERCVEMRKTLKLSGDFCYLALPLFVGEDIVGCIVLKSSGDFDEDEVELLESLASDVGIALRVASMEKVRKTVVDVLMENLEHFEELADRLFNPLAIMKGYMEIRDHISCDELLRKFEAEISRIESILNELRAREQITYEMKKILDRFESRASR
ncbi:MAG: PAS domain S-box protein [Archaeoglobaceae archaeon]